MKVLVAGGTGLIGSHIIDRLLAEGTDEVFCGARRPERVTRWGSRVRAVKLDLRDPATLDAAMRGMDAVIHCVQFPNHPVENPRRGYTYLEIDGKGTVASVTAAKASGVKRFIYLSGAGAGRGRAQAWFRAKDMAEDAIRQSGIEYVILRPSWVYGPEDRSLNRFIGFARWLPFVPVIGNGKNRVQPLSVFDVARVAAAALRKPEAANHSFELGGPENLTMDEIIRMALRVVGKRRFLFHQPAWMMKLVAGVLQFLPGPPLTPAAIDFILMEEPVDTRAAVEVFGPFERLEDGLRRYLKP